MERKSNQEVINAITEALYELLDEKNINEISIKELTEKAGVSRVSFYRNFDSKEEIIRKDLKRITDGYMNRTGVDYMKDDPLLYFENLFQHLQDHKDLGQHLIDTNMLNYLKEEFDRAFVHHGPAKNQIYIDYMMAGACYNLAYYWMITGFQETPRQMAEIITQHLSKNM